MKHRLSLYLCATTLITQATLAGDNNKLANLAPQPNAAGLLATFNANGGDIDLTGPFFQPLGTNGRTCASCHQPAQGWSITPQEIQQRFASTKGTDPIFRPNDGANCDKNIDTATMQGRRAAYSLLLNRGLIRVALPVPSNAEFDVVSVYNPYGCNDPATLSMYRRPLPSANLRFLSTVMWDGRESTPQTGTQKITFATNPGDLLANLAHQAQDAVSGHAQGIALLTPAQIDAIVKFEMGLVTAQNFDFRAGALDASGALGGPAHLAKSTMPAFFVGINDPLGGNPHGTTFTPVIFNLFDVWNNWRSNPNSNSQNSHRASILRGQQLFNSKPINITNVGGLNDDLNVPVIPGTCGTCHDSPNVGNHSVSAPLNIGVSDVTSPLGVQYLPVITLQHKTTREIKITTDPGRALITGAWKDVGRLKGPVLRGLASRAPYFHNGSASTLSEVLEFYEQRFQIGLTAQERADLVAFLNTL